MRRAWDDFARRVPLDTSEISQPVLNIENRSRTNLFPWNGQFSPLLIEALLARYAGKDAVVLDPFAGSGTVLCEAGRRQLRAVGAEINPAALRMASTYELINVPHAERSPLLRSLDDIIHPLSSPERRRSALLSGLVRAAATAPDRRAAGLLETLIIRLDHRRAPLSGARLAEAWARLRALVCALPHSPEPIRAHNVDARDLPAITPPADLVLTSPPYINVFNYHQQYRPSAEALGWDLLRVARSEIGANRKHRGNRFLTVAQYCLDMTQVLAHLAQRCRPSARLIFVLGRESCVLGTSFCTGLIFHLLAEEALGMRTVLRQERAFTNRFGQLICEDLLHFELPRRPPAGAPLARAREVAEGILKDAAARAPATARARLHAALARLDTVAPSPVFNRTDARRAFSSLSGAGGALRVAASPSSPAPA
jgi:hypothetical protein